ncbi:hypothetical protein KIPB_003692 [Kipferlia bialata]|uniref:Uncharacterized protein n=1 Tax=Kipferlia bialata TaxID=797122 RepID=A0A9K3CVU7_9EUKA|nr:hypothetical protein KIPB_003692 [Kipferlia bialata]|eukprot:g3692.t1
MCDESREDGREEEGETEGWYWRYRLETGLRELDRVTHIISIGENTVLALKEKSLEELEGDGEGEGEVFGETGMSGVILSRQDRDSLYRVCGGTGAVPTGVHATSSAAYVSGRRGDVSVCVGPGYSRVAYSPSTHTH